MINNKVVKVEIEVTGCADCPYCDKIRAWGGLWTHVNPDGKVYVCEKGAYGMDGYNDRPIRFHPNCPINKDKEPMDALTFLVTEIRHGTIDISQLASEFDKYNLKLSFKKGEKSNEK